jgi:pimeloyl-ACP methyl ester carboxylesterase
MGSISERESKEIAAANASGTTPVVFIHGLWLLPSSWASWADFVQTGRLRAADAGLAR